MTGNRSLSLFLHLSIVRFSPIFWTQFLIDSIRVYAFVYVVLWEPYTWFVFSPMVLLFYALLWEEYIWFVFFSDVPVAMCVFRLLTTSAILILRNDKDKSQFIGNSVTQTLLVTDCFLVTCGTVKILIILNLFQYVKFKRFYLFVLNDKLKNWILFPHLRRLKSIFFWSVSASFSTCLLYTSRCV